MRRSSLGAATQINKTTRLQRHHATLVVGVLVAIVPAGLELRASARIAERLAECDDGTNGCGGIESFDLDIEGLHLDELWVVRHGWIAGGHSVRLTLHRSGIHVDVREPWLRRAATNEDVAERRTARLARASLDAPDLGLTITTVGDLNIPDTPVGTLTMHNPTVRWHARGPLQLETEGALEHPLGRVDTMGTVHAHIWGTAPKKVRVAGPLSLGGGITTATTIELRGEALRIALDDGQGGRLELDVPEDGTLLDVRARRFALERLGTFASQLVPEPSIDAMALVIDGRVVIESRSRSLHEATLRLHDTTIHGLAIEHPKLSSRRVEFDALALAGEVSWRVEHLEAELSLEHRGARLQLAASRTPERFEWAAELPPLTCQAALDALPKGITGVLATSRYAGELGGRLALSVDLAALADARGQTHARDDISPGTLELDFAPFERCTPLTDASPIDLAALRGPYRHRFVDDRGRTHERIMTDGAPHYVRLSSVPLLAAAFSLLEDTRFWEHDGFDHEQIERAFWHDLVAGRAARGASTITQQTARTLWLGVERSLARKLQEALLAVRLEQSLDKARILELYLNLIELGPGVHGVHEAAHHYFGKPAHALDPLEALHLASMAPAPRTLGERFADGEVDEVWMAQLHHHLRRMHRHGHITHDQLMQSLRKPLRLRAAGRAKPMVPA